MSLRKTLSIRRKKEKVSFDLSADAKTSFDSESPLPPLPPLARLSSFVDASFNKFKRFGKQSAEGNEDEVEETKSVDSAPEELASMSPEYDPVEVCSIESHPMHSNR